VGFSLKNLRFNAYNMFLDKKNMVVPESFEEITEAMAEKLAHQIPVLLRSIDILQKNKIPPQSLKLETEKWIDRTSKELIELKETVIKRKHSYIETLSENEQMRLAERHPVWMNGFNLYLEQIQDLMAIQRDEKTIIQCILKADILRSLKIYYYATDGDVLTINSLSSFKYTTCGTSAPWEANVVQSGIADRPKSRFIFLPTPEGHAQWIFIGNRWWIDNHRLWLDFGKCNSDEDID